MSQTLTSRPAVRVAGAGLLLVAALVPVVGFMALAHTVEGESSATMTPAQVCDRAGAWLVFSCLWVLPVILAALAFVRLATAVGHDRSVRPLAAAGATFLVGDVLAQAGPRWRR